MTRPRVLIDPPRGALIDGVIAAHTAWREDCTTVQAAYERWLDAEPRGRRFAFLAYRAALDREEAAARVYESRAERLMRQPLDTHGRAA